MQVFFIMIFRRKKICRQNGEKKKYLDLKDAKDIYNLTLQFVNFWEILRKITKTLFKKDNDENRSDFFIVWKKSGFGEKQKRVERKNRMEIISYRVTPH